MDNHKITNFTDTIVDGDAANKKYAPNVTLDGRLIMTGNLIVNSKNAPSLCLGCNDLNVSA